MGFNDKTFVLYVNNSTQKLDLCDIRARHKNDITENYVSAVEPRSFHCANEELRTIGVRS